MAAVTSQESSLAESQDAPRRSSVSSLHYGRDGFDVMTVGSYLGSSAEDPAAIPALSRPLTG